MEVAVINYNAGNVKSVLFALKRVGIEAKLTGDPKEIINADKVIFPGVGEASSTMKYLINKGLDKVIKELKQPVLGICLGMQLMCEYSEENDTTCLGIFPQKVKLFRPPRNNEIFKVPHMGWNNINQLQSALFESVPENAYMYFVHSYYVEAGEYTTATVNYIQDFSAAVHKDNFYATQFHPERSGSVGAQILENFIRHDL